MAEEDQFSVEAKKKNFDYYDPLTTHNSSLSVCTQSIVASEIGYADKAREYFDFAVAMDLSDVGGNIINGAHIASIGGSCVCPWSTALGACATTAAQCRSGRACRPVWTRLRLPLTVRGNLIHVDVRRDETIYTLHGGDGLTVPTKARPCTWRRVRPLSQEEQGGELLARRRRERAGGGCGGKRACGCSGPR